MAEQIQELINKIKIEGVEEAKSKARAIEEAAKSEAVQIVSKAKKEAEKILADAKTEAQKIKESGEKDLKHASRDMLINLKKNIQDVLLKVISAEVGSALSSENLANIISAVVEKNQEASGIEIYLSKEDLNKLKQGFIDKLKKKLKQPIEFKDLEDINKGFIISFDEGKSGYDFTDKSLAQYLGSYLNRELAKILEESI